MIVIIWVVGAALLGILGYAMYSSRKNAGRSSERDDEFSSRADIVAEIASLDEEFEGGEVDEDQYRDRRDELKRLALESEDAAPAQHPESFGVSEGPEK